MARMIPISRVCSATRVLIVLEIRTTADSRAKTVRALRNREGLGVGLARPVAEVADLREVREAVEPLHRFQVGAHRLDRRLGGVRTRVVEPQGQPVDTRLAAQLRHRRRRRVQHDHVVVLDVLAPRQAAGPPGERERAVLTRAAQHGDLVARSAVVQPDVGVLDVGDQFTVAGQGPGVDPDDVDLLGGEVAHPDHTGRGPSLTDQDPHVDARGRPRRRPRWGGRRCRRVGRR